MGPEHGFDLDHPWISTRFLAKHTPMPRSGKPWRHNRSRLNCYIGFIKIDPVTFLVNPYTDAFNLLYDGKTREVQIGFLVNNYVSYGAWSAEKKLLQMQIVEGGIFIDGQLQSALLPSSIPFLIEGSRE